MLGTQTLTFRLDVFHMVVLRGASSPLDISPLQHPSRLRFAFRRPEDKQIGALFIGLIRVFEAPFLLGIPLEIGDPCPKIERESRVERGEPYEIKRQPGEALTSAQRQTYPEQNLSEIIGMP